MAYLPIKIGPSKELMHGSKGLGKKLAKRPEEVIPS
jgi:hypothetical protein